MNRNRNYRGFTLIEILVSIGIIAVLIGIALPALSGARQRASDVVGLSNLRQTGLVFESYTQTFNGWLPFAYEGTQFSTTPRVPPEALSSDSHWALSKYWSSLFHEIAPWREWFQMWTFPDPRRSVDEPWIILEQGGALSNGVSSLRYSRALFARPEIWEVGEMVEDRDSVLRGVRMSEVRFPSSKVSLFDGELCVRVRCDSELEAKRGMLFLDGHAALLATGDAIEPVQGRMPYLGEPEPLHDTAGGAYGRDYP